MKNLTWEGNEWQGLLFVYACFLMLLGWLAKLRSRFHPKKFLIKCWCACLRLVLRSAWMILVSGLSCYSAGSNAAPRMHGRLPVPYTPLHSQQLPRPPCPAGVTKPKGRSNLNLRPRIAFGWQKSERSRRRSMTMTEFNSLTFAISREKICIIFIYFLTYAPR